MHVYYNVSTEPSKELIIEFLGFLWCFIFLPFKYSLPKNCTIIQDTYLLNENGLILIANRVAVLKHVFIAVWNPVS